MIDLLRKKIFGEHAGDICERAGCKSDHSKEVELTPETATRTCDRVAEIIFAKIILDMNDDLIGNLMNDVGKILRRYYDRHDQENKTESEFFSEEFYGDVRDIWADMHLVFKKHPKAALLIKYMHIYSDKFLNHPGLRTLASNKIIIQRLIATYQFMQVAEFAHESKNIINQGA